MISVKEATQITLDQTAPIGTEVVSILEATGNVAAEDVLSDIDMPPFDKSSMDGYALRADDVRNCPAVLDVVGFIAAGDYPDLTVKSGQAVKIMTGAPLPNGADSVQMVEKTESLATNKVTILESVIPGKHIARRSEVMAADAKVLDQGTYLTSAMAGVLATVGKEEIRIYRRPRISILVTGNELVPAGQRPDKGQIRNSNSYALYNQVLQSGGRPELLGIVQDNLDELNAKIEQGLSNDILLVTGGVSMGDLDLVEGVLEKLGVKVFYNKVNIKPGKPTVFGRRDETLVFGLPGNPVSASTVFEVIVKPALRKAMGFAKWHNVRMNATIAKDFSSKTKRENYPAAWTCFSDSKFVTTPVNSKGSADVLAFANSNSFLVIPGEIDDLEEGQGVEVLLRDEFWRTCASRVS